MTDERGLRRPRSRLTDDAARAMLIRLAGGDARRALTSLEAAAAGAQALRPTARRSTPATSSRRSTGPPSATTATATSTTTSPARSSRASAGSDVDAALHYLARMVEAGEDPRFIARRLVILAPARTSGWPTRPRCRPRSPRPRRSRSSGCPRRRINLAQAVIHLALAPKSNAVILAIGAADRPTCAAGPVGPVPAHLRDAHYPGAAAARPRRGLPVPARRPARRRRRSSTPRTSWPAARYYQPTDHGAEAALAARLARIAELLGSAERP